MNKLQQKCKVCGRIDKFDFHVPDEVWTRIIPLVYIDKVVCLSCFDDFAQRVGVKYADSLQWLYFAGNRASFELSVTAKSD